MTEIQLKQAYKLARAFGHAWAEADFEELPHTVEAIREFTIARKKAELGTMYQDWMAGFAAPYFWHGNVTHKSTTGRIRWVVDRDGSIRLVIRRPGGPVLWATVGPDGSLDDLTGEGYYSRHVEALREALLAVADPAEVELYLGELKPLPDEPEEEPDAEECLREARRRRNEERDDPARAEGFTAGGGRPSHGWYGR